MHYFALLVGSESNRPVDPDAQAAEMTAYQNFPAAAASAIRAGDALMPSGVQRHLEFGKAAADHIRGGAGLHPPSTATTVRVRDGKAILTDGPYVEGAEVANGFYILSATDKDQPVKIASMIPASGVELRQLAGVSGL